MIPPGARQCERRERMCDGIQAGASGNNYARNAAGVTMDNAFGTMRKISGNGPIGSPSTWAKTAPVPTGSQTISVAFQESIPRILRSFPTHRAGKQMEKGKRLQVEFITISKESSNKLAPVVILNGPP